MISGVSEITAHRPVNPIAKPRPPVTTLATPIGISTSPTGLRCRGCLTVNKTGFPDKRADPHAAHGIVLNTDG